MTDAGWAEILNSCNGVSTPDFGCADQFTDLPWQPQGQVETRLLNSNTATASLNNFVGFDGRVQTVFGSAAQPMYGSHEDHGNMRRLMGEGGSGVYPEFSQILHDDQQHLEKRTSSFSNVHVSTPPRIMESCEGKPPKSGRRTHIQRVNHILAERQRREEMNDKFSMLRSFIPRPTKKDKASIIAETIDYVLEMRQTLKRLRECKEERLASRGPAKLRKTGAPNSPQKLDISPTPDTREADNSVVEEPKTRTVQWESGQVEIQEINGHAVIKILSTRKRGLVMQIQHALDECKVDVIQSNVTTIGDKMVQFTTVQMNSGVSPNINKIIDALGQVSALR